MTQPKKQNNKTFRIWNVQLAFIFLMCCTLFYAVSGLVAAQNSGSLSVEGVVPAPPPNQPPVITKPTKGDSFSSSPITVSGTCISETVVEVYKNGVFAGSTACVDEKFSLEVSLFKGKNILVAKLKDSLGQYGPDSEPLTVTYRPLVDSEEDQKSNSAELLLTVDAEYRGAFPDETLTIEPQIIGGQPPYAVDIDWGDKESTLEVRQNSGVFKARHIYEAAGIKTIKISATDSSRQEAFIQTVAVINGKPARVETLREIDKIADKKSEPFVTTPIGFAITTGVIALGTSLVGVFIGFQYSRHLTAKSQYKNAEKKD